MSPDRATPRDLRSRGAPPGDSAADAPSPARALARTPRALLASAFFLSGAAGLAYEVAWSRALLLLLGSTAAAAAVVLGTFVGALGFGARWGGRLAERHPRPLLLYGLFEIGAALWALISIPLTGLLEGPYVALAAGAPGWLQMFLRVLVALIVIVPAAFMLGATLPAMVRHWVRRAGETGRQTAWLYGANTVGAVAGCLFTGFVGVALWGVQGMLLVAALVGGGVGIVTVIFGLRTAPLVTSGVARASEPQGGPERGVPKVRSPAFQAALLLGFLGLAIEVVGFRILVFFLEGFTATFAAMLGVFIAGLGIGSLVLGPVLVRTLKPARLLGVLVLLTAATLVFDLYVVIPSLEGWMQDIRAMAYADAAGSEDVAAGLHLTSLIGAALLLFVPALLLGPTFALCVRWAELDGEKPGHAVGNTYLWNSAGSLTAPFVFTFLIVPVFHVPGAWSLLVVLALVAGAVLASWPATVRDGEGRLRLASLAGLAVGIGVMWLGPPGAAPEDLLRASVVLHDKPDRELMLVQSDAVTTASVVQNETGERYLYTDDFAAAATGRHYRYMRMLGHLPAVLAKDPQNAMVIAFGTGTTAGAVAQHKDVKRLEVVEVSSAVLDLATYFTEANRFVLDDDRVEVVRDDGRNALLLHEPDLDVITLEPLMPYSPAGFPFYTREFYELARDRLREGGVLCQWIPVHAMPVGLYAAFLRAFYEVFPDGTLWFFEQSTALIGRKGTATPDRMTVLDRLHAVREDLAQAGFADPQLLLSGYVANGREILAFQPPHDYTPYAQRPLVDMDPYPEFKPTPRAPLNTPYLHHTLTYLLGLAAEGKEPQARSWWPAQAGNALKAGGLFALRGRQQQAEADFLQISLRGVPRDSAAWRMREEAWLQKLEEAARAYAKARGILPGETVIERRHVRVLRTMARIRVRQLLERAAGLASAGKDAEAREMLVLAESMARAVLPPQLDDPDPVATERIDAAALHVAVLLRLGRCEQAARVLTEARADLADERREQPLNDLLDAVEGWRRGRAPNLDARWSWVVANRIACREEGLAPVRDAWERYVAAERGSPQRLRRSAARRLSKLTRDEGSDAAVLAALREAAPAADPSVSALRAAVIRTLDARDGALTTLLLDDSPVVRRAALVEAGWWGFLERHPDVLDRAVASADAKTRKALATAAAKHGRLDVLRRVAELLMDAELDVRKEAWSVFVQHRANLIEAYDPNASEDARRPVVERLKAALAP
ncbi:MAG: hypothetical protein QNJ90_12605 [Planctomycetota bacterium]|nr:hypothetical protein [Planctomycetota bacterium]